MKKGNFMKAYTINLIVIIAILLVLSGCYNNSQDNIMSTESPDYTAVITKLSSEEPSANPTESNNVSTSADGNQVGILNKRIIEAPILENGLTLDEIAKLMDMNEEELIEEYGDSVKQTRWGLELHESREYLKDDFRLNLVYIKDDSSETYRIKYVELDRNKISFNSISKDSNFEDVKEILGETEINVNEDGLPGLLSYELRYQYNDIRLRIYSWDNEGNDGIYMSVVDDFLPEYRTIRITPEQINQYFKMTKEELTAIIGEGKVSMSYNNERQYIDYSNYGISFGFDKNGLKLYSINFPSNYQINDLRQGVSLENAMEIMGERPVESYFSEDSGSSYLVKYEFENYTLIVRHDEEYSDGTYWQINRNDNK